MDDRRPSKTQRKKAMHDLRDLGAELVELSAERLAAIELPDTLRDAVTEARRINSFGARKRQLQYIGKIMRKVDAEPIRAALDAWRTTSDAHTAAHKRIEAWRDRLLADDAALAALAAEYPTADTSRLSALIRNAARERSAGQPPRSFRELYQALRELLEKA
ncbi:MAG TPA: ribosome biogenesis factor YjgA [Burkholderiales bacterium]|nr:ribosome biogenesis factor YjgA [Burkholderiales bacterium]